METIFKHFLLIVSAFCFAETVAGQNPTIDPVAVFTNSESEQTELRPGESYSGSAPLTVEFNANPQDADGWTATYEWRFYTEGNTQQPYLIRYEENTDYTFTSAGTHLVACYAVFKRGDERIEYTEEYWTTEAQPIQISISESNLEMPNAFAPNGDPRSSIYKAKKNYKSIVEFHAIIINRWGQKLYEWDDPAGGWDGTFHGNPVAEGTYFVIVNAKGADGKVFKIRKDVNLLRGYREPASTTNP